MWKPTLAAILLASCWLLLACDSGPGSPEVTLEVAEDWTFSSGNRVVDEVAKLVVREVSPAPELAGDTLTDQIRERLEWSYSAPTRESDSLYTVTATVVTRVIIDVPVLPYPVTNEVVIVDRMREPIERQRLGPNEIVIVDRMREAIEPQRLGPLIPAKSYDVHLPFKLRVDVKEKTVTNWEPDISRASVTEL